MNVGLASAGRWVLPALLLLALTVRIGAIIATPDYRPRHDDRDYDRLACWVAEHGLPPDRVPPLPDRSTCAERGRPGALTAYRAPLWPMTLGAAYAAARQLGVPRWTAGRVLQAALGTAVVALTGAIAAELWSVTVGLLAAALSAVFLPLVLDGATLISEPLFVVLELGAVLAVLRYRRSARGLRWAAVAGLLIGLAALTRSSGPLLGLALVPALVVAPRRRAVMGAAVFLAAALLVVLPWSVRNANVVHAFVPVTTEVGPTLLGTYNAAAREPPGCTACWVMLSRTRGETRLAHRLLAMTEVERDRESRSLAFRFAVAHPGYVAQVAWSNSLRLLELGGEGRTRFTAETIDVPPGAAVVGSWQLWLVLAIIAIGAVTGALRRVPPGLLALLAFLWATTVLVQSETPRFRAAIDPLVLMLAAVSLAAVGTRAAQWRAG